jgi:hypothetical protein
VPGGSAPKPPTRPLAIGSAAPEDAPPSSGVSPVWAIPAASPVTSPPASPMRQPGAGSQRQPGTIGAIGFAAGSLPAFFAIASREFVSAASPLHATPNTRRGSLSPPSIPTSPAPAPAPVGGSTPAGGGASGFGFSVLLTLAGLLVLGAPWAGRRMRLASESWSPAPFLLMPERPG